MGLLSADDIKAFRESVALMRELGVKRVRNGDLDIEIDLAFTPKANTPLEESKPDVAPESRTCACGHDLDVEHNEYGCLHTCSPQQCASREPPKE